MNALPVRSIMFINYAAFHIKSTHTHTHTHTHCDVAHIPLPGILDFPVNCCVFCLFLNLDCIEGDLNNVFFFFGM